VFYSSASNIRTFLFATLVCHWHNVLLVRLVLSVLYRRTLQELVYERRDKPYANLHELRKVWACFYSLETGSIELKL